MDKRQRDRWKCSLSPFIRKTILNNYIHRVHRQTLWRKKNEINKTYILKGERIMPDLIELFEIEDYSYTNTIDEPIINQEYFKDDIVISELPLFKYGFGDLQYGEI